MGVLTDEAIANDLGFDIEDVYDARVREREMRRERGLPEAGPLTPDPVAMTLATKGDE